MNALEMALEALTNPSTIAVQHAIELIKKKLAKPEREWVGLTDDEIHKIIDNCTPDNAGQEELNDFARAVRFAEAKLKETNA